MDTQVGLIDRHSVRANIIPSDSKSKHESVVIYYSSLLFTILYCKHASIRPSPQTVAKDM